MSSIKNLLALAIVATLATTVFAVHCYTCESVTNKKCGEQFEPEENMKIDCSKADKPAYVISWLTGTNLNATGCMKQTIDTKIDGIKVVRSCYFGEIANKDKGCKSALEITATQMTCDVCTGNLCNGSSSMAPVVIAIVAFFGLARIFS